MDGWQIWSDEIKDKDDRRAVAVAVSECAQELVDLACTSQVELPRDLFPFMMHASLAKQFLKILRTNDYEILDPTFYAPSRLTLAALWSMITRKVY